MEEILDHLRRLATAAAPGTRLPPTRELMKRFAAGPGTVQRAVQELVRAGLVETRPGSGSYVRASRPLSREDLSWQTDALGAARAGADPIGAVLRVHGDDTIPMHSGYPAPALLPGTLVRQAAHRAARTLSSRPPSQGLAGLREWFASGARGTGAGSPADVVIVPGGQSALSLVFRSLANPGDAVIMESPTYWGAMIAARQAGLTVVPVSRTAHAPAPAALDRAFAASGARIFYAQPAFANPTGATWSRAEGDAILEVVRSNGAFIVEDDWAHDFAIGEPAPPLTERDADGHVVYVRSLTKSVSPDIRVAGIVARGPARARLADAQAIENLYVSGLLQRIALDVVTQPAWRTHLRVLREQLRSRRDRLAELVRLDLADCELASVPPGGLNLWLRLPPGASAADIAARSLARGLAVSAGDAWFPTEPPAPHLRLNYAAADPAEFPRAVEILRSSLE